MVRCRNFLILMVYQTSVNLACHSLSSQYNQFPSRRARARGVSSLEKTSENAIDFDYLTSNLPYSATEIRSMSSLTPIPNVPLLTVSDGGKLTCNFDNEMEYCGWHNAESTEVKFWKGKLDSESSFDSQRFESSSSLAFSADNNFLLAGGEPMVDSNTAALEMEIPCQYGDADVKFDFWTNSLTVDVRYCFAKQGNDFDSCQLLQRVSNPLNFSIPTTVDELRVRIEVTNIDGDSIALIDNLHYNGQICELIDEATEHSLVPFNGDSSSVPTLITGEPSTDPTVQKFFEEDSAASEDIEASSAFSVEIRTSTAPSKSGTSHVNVRELSFCSALTCSFNDGDSCFYGLSGVGSTSAWILSDRLIGNRHTGIQRVNLDDQSKVGFAYVGGDDKSEKESIFVVESPKFSLIHDILLVFDVYIRSVTPKLKVCIDNFENCPYISHPVRKNKFWLGNQNVTLKEGSRKVFFVVENVEKHQFLAIDNIRVESIDGSSLC